MSEKNELSNQLLSVIEKNLPAQTVGIIRDQLNKLQSLEVLYENRGVVIESNEKRIKELSEQLKNQQDIEELALRATKEMEEAIQIKNDFAVKEANLKADEAQKRSDGIFELAKIAFRNPVLKHNYNLHSMPIWGNDGSVAPGGKNGTVTEELE